MTKFHQGKFSPRNPRKYEGNPTDIVFRSSWEYSFMYFCDTNDGIRAWSSEKIVIPYISPVDNDVHRYFVDFKVTFSKGQVWLVEIKPNKQTKEPKVKKKVSKSYITEVVTHAINKAKWEAADLYAKKKGWTFKVLTEESLATMGIQVMTNFPNK